MRRIIWAGLLFVWSALTAAQTRVSDMAATGSFNSAMSNAKRSLHYRPEGKAFVCVNGDNRFTRALYGGYTEWRLETSDRPVFAVYKKGNCRNVRFYADDGASVVSLDSTGYCRAAYERGQRSYLLRDRRWGSGVVSVDVAALHDDEGGVFRFRTDSFAAPVRIKVVVSTVLRPKMQRSGDLGVDAPDCFEAAPGGQCGAKEFLLDDECVLLLMGTDSLVVAPNYDYDCLANYWNELPGIRFHTPDAYINTLDGALMAAADGIWDGDTFLHGAVGWRMPLAGWRAAYAGDVLGWFDRARKHFDAYAESQVDSVPPVIAHPSQDPAMQMARAEKKWGTQMYSDGYICRNPHRNDQLHHYDMNLNYVDELLWHFQYDADTVYMRRLWPLLKRHLAWEKRNYDPDGDHLYDAYCCIWASDALYYSGGAVTHSSAYNYRGNRLAARIAELLGEDAEPYRQEAAAIQQAMNRSLWLNEEGVWTEYQDGMGLRRLHRSPALWSVYTPIDCGVGSPSQSFRATQWVSRSIPHIDVEDTGLQTVSTSNWMPYSWSINNVANAEVWHMALAYFEAGRPHEGFALLKANVMDNMYYGRSPGNFGQLSYYDAARGECYRDFGDCVGIASRALVQGLFGVVPNALDGQCVIRPGFPSEWDSVTFHSPYLDYEYTCRDGVLRFVITQRFSQPQCIVVRQNLPGGQWLDVVGSADAHQVIEIPLVPAQSIGATSDSQPCQAPLSSSALGLDEPDMHSKFRKQDLSPYFNAEVDDVFKNSYESPRPPTTTLQIPLQGVGEWCHPQYTPEINDSVFRTLTANGVFRVAGVPFFTPSEGRNIVYTSQWDNYPNEASVPLRGRAASAYLLMAGTTNHMQSRIDNALVVVVYHDGSSDTLRLRNPDNWCPIEQDYYVDSLQFTTTLPRPYRVCLATGTVSRDLGRDLQIEGVYGREIPGGAAQMLRMPLNRKKKLRSLTVRPLSNDVVIGLMGVTLQ